MKCKVKVPFEQSVLRTGYDVFEIEYENQDELDEIMDSLDYGDPIKSVNETEENIYWEYIDSEREIMSKTTKTKKNINN